MSQPPCGGVDDERETALRQAVQDAIDDVREAQAGEAEALKLMKDAGAQIPNAAFAAQSALQHHSAALARLRAALREFEAYTAARWGRPLAR